MWNIFIGLKKKEQKVCFIQTIEFIKLKNITEHRETGMKTGVENIVCSGDKNKNWF